jgi:uncharacterized protein (TIGR02246 family)
MSRAHSTSGRHYQLRRTITRLSVALSVVGGGCAGESVTATDTDRVPAAASAEIGSAPSQTGAIAELVALATAAWTAKDAAAYASIYSEDALVISPVGGYLVGREGVRQGHVFLFNGPFAGSTQTISITGIRFLTGTIALVDQDVTLTGYAFLPPNGLRATTPGVVRTTVRWVVMKRGGTWEIVAQQMTPIPPTP